MKKKKKPLGPQLWVGCVQFCHMMEKRGIRSLSKGICTHLSSVRLIRILPSVENTIKDIRNCGLGQGRQYHLLALWPVLITFFPTVHFLSLPYEFMSEMFNKVVDFSPVMLNTARSEWRKSKAVMGGGSNQKLTRCIGFVSRNVLWSSIHIFVTGVCT